MGRMPIKADEPITLLDLEKNLTAIEPKAEIPNDAQNQYVLRNRAEVAHK